MKKVIWMGSSKADMKVFPAAVVDDMGHQLFLVQCGFEPDDWKPMTTVGTGVKEIRGRTLLVSFAPFIWRPGQRPFMCCTVFRRKRSRPRSAISNWREND